jgi:hypothetical protein
VFTAHLYARVRIFLMHNAHETAGAARTRHSLLPLFVRRDNELQNSGETRREDESAWLFEIQIPTRHPKVRALRCTCTTGRASKDESATGGPVVLRGAQGRAPQDDGITFLLRRTDAPPEPVIRPAKPDRVAGDDGSEEDRASAHPPSAVRTMLARSDFRYGFASSSTPESSRP